MSIRMRLTKPDEIEATMSITLTLKDWKKLRDQISTNEYPAWTLDRQIRDMILRLETFVAQDEVKVPE
ncbi:MAG: hypothetical protein ABFD96_05855 [Armatimonadia bacterium]